MKGVQEMISHYQRSIERSGNDNVRLMHCIDKLGRLPISVKHLQDTGIGRTVNGLRKYDGDVGMQAKKLVQIWKDMVANEDASSPEIHQAEISDNNDSFVEKTTVERDVSPTLELSHREGRSHQKSSSSSHHSSSDRKNSHKSGSSKSSDRHSKSHSSQEHHRSSKHSAEYSTHHRNGDASTHVDTPDDKNDESELLVADVPSMDKDVRHRHKENKGSGGHSKSSDRHKSASSSSRNSSSHNHHRNNKDDKDTHRTSSKEVEKKKSADEENKKKSREASESGHSHESSNKRKMPELDQSNTKPHSGESALSNASKRPKTSSKSKTDKAKPLAVEDDGIDITSGKSFAEALGMMFETPPSISKSHSTNSPKASSSKRSKTTASSSSAAASQLLMAPPKKIEKIMKSSSSAPVLLSPAVKLKPLDDLSLDLPLPQIVTNYTPMPLNSTVMECVYGKTKPVIKPLPQSWTDETFGATLAARNMKTRVYSGVRTGQLFQVPTLMEICIRVLQKNIDAMEYTGGVPFEILKPVLERASPDQLFTFEHFNPYLMDDSDFLWEQHCGRKFRTQKREEMETWRDMFIRCTEEQEERLNSLTMNIKRSQTQSIPVRSTKMAFVDSMVKPPRGVQRKQLTYGTDRKLIATPAARVASLSSMGNNIAKIGDTRLKVLAGSRDTAQATCSRPKKAPLMQKLQKSLSSLKGRFKR